MIDLGDFGLDVEACQRLLNRPRAELGIDRTVLRGRAQLEQTDRRQFPALRANAGGRWERFDHLCWGCLRWRGASLLLSSWSTHQTRQPRRQHAPAGPDV